MADADEDAADAGALASLTLRALHEDQSHHTMHPLPVQVPDGSIYSMAVWPLFVCKAAWGPDAGQELGLDALAVGGAMLLWGSCLQASAQPCQHDPC